MTLLSFVIWMIGFPLSITISEYIAFKITGKYTKNDSDTSVTLILIWIAVGFAIYVKC